MKHYFERCSCSIMYNGELLEYGNNDDILKKQYEYIKVGLIPNFEKDLYIRDGYGALVFSCGSHDTLEKVIDSCKKYNNYYDFPGKINDGYHFIIGPGVNVLGNFLGVKRVSDYAVYCTNYEEILEKLNGKQISKQSF